MKKTILSAAAAIGLAVSISANVSAEEQTYKVKQGDSLWKISVENNISVRQLMEWNGLHSNTIHAGQNLRISLPEKASETFVSHTVTAGDTLWKIAKKYNSTIQEIKSANHLSSDVIKIGQKLKIPQNGQSSPKEKISNSKTYTVKSGDTLWKIAQNHNITVNQLKALNNLANDKIYAGQVLKLQKGEKASKSAVGNQIFNADALISEAKKYIGTPYVWGGTSPSGFDCSGFIHYVFNKIGHSIPRTVATIWNAGTGVSSPQKGDIVFFNTSGKGLSHAGIYIGGNSFIHAGTSTGVTISNMDNAYWSPRYMGAKSIR